MEISLPTKIAATKHNLSEFIVQRWSPRAFSTKTVTEADLEGILEAASWAYSANNAQPWDYYFAHREDEQGFSKLLSCLVPANQIWAKNSAVLIAAVARKKFENGAVNSFARHDLGAANACLSAEAINRGIDTHVMGGFDGQKAITELQLNAEDQDPVVFIALGYRGDPSILEEPLLSRELNPRSRRALAESMHRIK